MPRGVVFLSPDALLNLEVKEFPGLKIFRDPSDVAPGIGLPGLGVVDFDIEIELDGARGVEVGSKPAPELAVNLSLIDSKELTELFSPVWGGVMECRKSRVSWLRVPCSRSGKFDKSAYLNPDESCP